MKQTQSASAEALRQAHQALLRDLRKLQDLVRSDSTASLAELRGRLGATYTHVCEHFRLEEQDGYVDKLAENEPRLGRVAQQLGEEHRELRHSLDALHGEAIVASRVDNDLCEKIRKWIDRLMRHERRENDLMQDAIDLDFAAQD